MELIPGFVSLLVPLQVQELGLVETSWTWDTPFHKEVGPCTGSSSFVFPTRSVRFVR